MRRAWVALAILVIYPVAGLAQQPNCLIGFGALSDSEAGRELLVSATYRELLDKVGAAKFTPVVLDKLIAGNDPFRLPEQTDGDLQVLQKNLKEFERMLETKGWSIPQVRSMLLVDLAKRREGVRRMETVQQKTVAKEWLDYVIPLNPALGVAESPNGRWLVTLAGGHLGRPPILRIYDVNSKQVVSQPRPNESFGEPRFNPDGKELLLTLPHQALMRVPFENGKADWASAKKIDQIGSSLTITGSVFFAHSADFAYAADGVDTLVRFNLTTGKASPVDVAAYLKGKGAADWGFIPGTDILYLLLGDSSGRKIHKVRIDENGVLHKVDELGFWPQRAQAEDNSPFQVMWTKTGSKAFAYGDSTLSEVTVVRGNGTTPEIVFATDPQDPKKFSAKQMLLSPSGDKAALLYTEHDARKIRLFDPETHKVLADFPVSTEVNHVEFSADGTRIYLHLWTGKIVAVNFERHLIDKE